MLSAASARDTASSRCGLSVRLSRLARTRRSASLSSTCFAVFLALAVETVGARPRPGARLPAPAGRSSGRARRTLLSHGLLGRAQRAGGLPATCSRAGQPWLGADGRPPNRLAVFVAADPFLLLIRAPRTARSVDVTARPVPATCGATGDTGAAGGPCRPRRPRGGRAGRRASARRRLRLGTAGPAGATRPRSGPRSPAGGRAGPRSLAQGHGLVEAQAFRAPATRDEPLGLLARAARPLPPARPLVPGRGGPGRDPDETRQDLVWDAARALCGCLRAGTARAPGSSSSSPRCVWSSTCYVLATRHQAAASSPRA